MAQIKKVVKQAMSEIKAQNMPTSQKLSSKCAICEKEFAQEPYHPLFNPNIRTTCSEECKQKMARIHREKNIDRLMTEAGIPPLFRSVVTDRNIEPYLKSNKGVYIWSDNTGPGKTVMACSIGRQLIIEGKKAKFISSPKFIVELQSAYTKNLAIDDMLNEVAKVEVLIIDDIGAEKLTDFVRQIFYYLINEREQWIKKTIITSNYSLDELDQYIDKRISSRIAGTCDVVELKGPDRRVRR